MRVTVLICQMPNRVAADVYTLCVARDDIAADKHRRYEAYDDNGSAHAMVNLRCLETVHRFYNYKLSLQTTFLLKRL